MRERFLILAAGNEVLSDYEMLELILFRAQPRGDFEATGKRAVENIAVIDVGKPLRIAVHDHIIVGKDGHASLNRLKLI